MIAEYGTIYLVLAVILGLYMTWGIGANDVANAMGTSIGSGAITFKQAIIIAAVLEFAGAFLAGGHVTNTIRKGIIDPTPIIDQPELLIWGMLAALMAAGVWLMVASYFGWPVSTTHSIVGALVGFAVVGIGSDAVQWGKIGAIVMSWILSPLIGGVFAFLVMMSIQRFILSAENPVKSAKRYAPFYIFLVGFIISLVTFFKGLKHLNLNLTIPQSFLAAVVIGALAAFIGKYYITKMSIKDPNDRGAQQHQIEKIFGLLQIFSACAMAFAHGSNDVANGIGPMAAVVSIVQSSGEVAQKSTVPLWILAVGGFGIIIGLATLGYRVIQTIGTKITELVPTRGFSAELAAAATVVLASRTGIPVSTTHIAVGAVMGVGMARGIGALDVRVIGGIFLSWIVTLPVGAILSIVFFYIFRGIFL
ncbi:MAG: inorganic phosphate transporter [SAR324 cluster bacterium]|nr:inorganic phosphate transporter [SAR324 cluster bacterium]